MNGYDANKQSQVYFFSVIRFLTLIEILKRIIQVKTSFHSSKALLFLHSVEALIISISDSGISSII